ncbi:bifunctional glutamine amidotransferase/anthranilate phosphoribosyltransferase [Commensalibacter papalotli (ex Servin-Garciduenas et al. 2014)]|uniref:Anthranilate phosphoribosyltransferase n=1 Tax=Commensalibacter papalotli (ex Servin-Garciduenas et al. 2014) TaxID=1208583 RepID=W7DX61_9PROT|nr:bifunctional glutamine amidotransferase/anthranilate phosphoribosyltransferase [Commensalibacter papalotli (ex Servin-Garciduenas et al. 2014)]
MILLIDNYDSFTYNLVQYFGDLGYECQVRRNDEITVKEVIALKPEAIVISPGPCTPSEAGICCDLIKAAATTIPILGVCLGHQAIGQAFGAKVVKEIPAHGKVFPIMHTGEGVFKGLNNPLKVTRYHSLVVQLDTLSDSFLPTAFTEDRILMAFQHKELPIYGVQFHPESIASEQGHELLQNFMNLASDWNKKKALNVSKYLPYLFTPTLEKSLQKNNFSLEETTEIFNAILSGSVPDTQIAAFLMVLRIRGVSVAELEGATRSMRHQMLPITLSDPLTIDVCGTGGDGQSTLNVSTAVSFVLAAMGVSVAKHGNRAQSSRSGGVDVLGALNLTPQTNLNILQNHLNKYKLAFLPAFVHHPALSKINIVRKELGIRTIFNLLGPLSNPANVQYQMIGVYDTKWLEPFAKVLQNLGSKRVWVVHGLLDETEQKQGVDEITLAGPSKIMALEDNKIIPVTLSLKDIQNAGLSPAPLSEITGGSPKENAASMLALFNGQKGAYRDTVLINTAVALHIVKDYSLINASGKIDTDILGKLILEAAKAIDSGAVLSILHAIQQNN